MKYYTGKSKPLEEASLDDMLENPIWIFALDEEDVENQDETWIKPILDVNDVKKQFVSVYILLRDKNSDKYVSANLDIKMMCLSDIAFWEYNQWQPLGSMDNIKFPLFIISIPDIMGEKNVHFIIDSKNGEGRRFNLS